MIRPSLLARLGRLGFGCACLLWLLMVASPAFLLCVVTLGAVRLDLRFSSAEPLFEVPGWTDHELTFYVPRWRPF